MKAMVLAAGLGTRLRPLTNDRPKALVEIGSRTLLEIALARLLEFGIREVIVNVHHFADMVADYLKANGNFGMRIELSREDILLDTGGGLKKAAWFFLEGSNLRDEPFVLHNVDVISDIDLHRMLQAHRLSQPLATLAVHHRESSRYLLFDTNLQLSGRRVIRADQEIRQHNDELVRPSTTVQPLAFSGIHVIAPRIFEKMSEQGAFSIIDCYLRLAGQGDSIQGFRADEFHWRDLGKPQNIAAAEAEMRRH